MTAQASIEAPAVGSVARSRLVLTALASVGAPAVGSVGRGG